MTDAKAAAEAATTKETFNFVEAVLDRSYPEFKVPVYINEALIQSFIEAKREVAALELSIARSKTKPGVEVADALGEAQDRVDKINDQLAKEQYTFTIRGIAPEDSIKLEEKAFELQPVTYEDSVHPISGATIKTEVPNKHRDETHATLIRQAHLVSIEAPNGAIDTDFADLEKVRVLWARLPALARTKVDEAINESTISVDFYREIVTEVF